MINLTSRQRDILSSLYYSNGYVTGKKLASLLNVSSRTIRTDIKYINIIFKNTVIESTHQGYYLYDASAFKGIVNNGLNSETDRTDSITYELLQCKEPTDIDELSDRLYLSKTSLFNEIKNIELGNNLSIQKNLNKIFVVGKEYEKRKALNRIITRNLSIKYVEQKDVINYFPDVDGEEVLIILNEVLKKYNYYIDNAYLNNLLLNIMIALSRIMDGFKSDTDDKVVISQTVADLSKEFTSKIKEAMNIELNDDDVKYFSYILQGQLKMINPSMNIDEIKKKALQILEETFDFFKLKIDFSKYEANFLNHIYLLVKRGQAFNLAQNNMHNIMKSRCPFVYDVAIHYANKLKNVFNIPINNTEISFIAVHLGNAIIDSKGQSEKLKAVLLNNDYLDSTSHLLEKISEDFGDKIEIISVSKNIDELSKIKKYDLLITTFPQIIFSNEYARISYLYTIDDKIRLLDKISKTIERKKNERIRNLLPELFDKRLFFKNTKINSKEDAIDFISSKLIKNNIVNEKFAKSVLEREELSSTVIDGVFAFPRSLSLDENKTKIAILISEKGFLYEGYRLPFIAVICVNHNDIRLYEDLLNNLTKILLFNDNYNHIFDIEDYDEFIEFIDSKLQSIY